MQHANSIVTNLTTCQRSGQEGDDLRTVAFSAATKSQQSCRSALVGRQDVGVKQLMKVVGPALRDRLRSWLCLRNDGGLRISTALHGLGFHARCMQAQEMHNVTDATPGCGLAGKLVTANSCCTTCDIPTLAYIYATPSALYSSQQTSKSVML